MTDTINESGRLRSTPAPATRPESADAFAAENAELASKLVNRFAVWSGVAGLIPVPVVDVVAVGGLQLQMLRRLSQLYGVPFSDNRGKALLASLGGALIPASSGIGAASALKAVPLFGTLASGFIMPVLSAGATYAIGKAFIEHFTSGGTLLDFNPPDYREFVRDKSRCGNRGRRLRRATRRRPPSTPKMRGQLPVPERRGILSPVSRRATHRIANSRERNHAPVASLRDRLRADRHWGHRPPWGIFYDVLPRSGLFSIYRFARPFAQFPISWSPMAAARLGRLPRPFLWPQRSSRAQLRAAAKGKVDGGTVAMSFLQLVRREMRGSLRKLLLMSSLGGISSAAILAAINAGTQAADQGKGPSLWAASLFVVSLYLFMKTQIYVTTTITGEIEAVSSAPPAPRRSNKAL